MLTLILVKRLKWNFFSINFKVQKRVVKNIGYAYLSQITTFLGSFLPVYLISSFSSGIMTSLNYAQRISQIPEQLIITQTSAVLGIKLNELNVKKQNNDVNRVLLEVASSTLFLTVPFSFLFALYGEKIVEMIYMRGRFDVASVNSTGVLLKYLGLSIPFVALNAFYSRVFIAFQRMKLAFYSGLVVNVLFLVLIYSFIQLLGPIGYPIAIATYLVCSVMIFFPFLFYWRVPEIDVAALSKCVFRVYIVNAILNFPVWLLLNEDIDLNIFLYAVWIVSCLVILNYYFKTSMHLYNFQKMILKKIGVSKIRFS
jgi:putative peptidoglycan lipid II flippase